MSAEAVAHLSQADKILGRPIKKIGPCGLKVDRRRAPYQALVRSVVYQQLNGVAAGTIFGRVLALYPKKRFPTPEELLATDEERLRVAGLSRAKLAAIRDIAAKTLEGVVPDSRQISRMTDADIIDRLTTIRGVGAWTVEMMLMFKLGRPDVLPITDYGVRKGFATVFGWEDLPSPKELLAHGERWRPFRSYAAWYLWRALD